MTTPDDLMHHIAAMLRDDDFRHRLVGLMRSSGNQPPADAAMHRAKVAAGMLDAGNRRCEVQGMLRERYGISRSQAYNDIAAALDLRGPKR